MITVGLRPRLMLRSFSARGRVVLRVVGLIGMLLATTLPQVGTAQSTLSRNPRDTTQARRLRETHSALSLPDSLYVTQDTLAKGDLDTIVRYWAADSTVFDADDRTMTLTNDAAVHFQQRQLDAYRIVLDFTQSTLIARSNNADSVLEATAGRQRRILRDTGRTLQRGAPKLSDGGTVYDGEVIVYNYKTKHGTVQLGTTEMEGGSYYGERIKQVAPKTLFVENGRYTTCTAPTPHYYFESPKMKVVMQDEIFAAPVMLYIADVPVMALPFAVFPDHSGGRHSGIIAPSYVTQGSRGYGLTHLGYYDVLSDYVDARAQADLYTKGGWNVDVAAEWMKRYLMNGAANIHLGYGYTRFNSVDPFQQNWLVQAQLPNLVLGYNSQFSANLSFQSNGYYQNNAQTTQDVVRQEVTSDASYNTAWEELGVNLGLDYHRTQNLRQRTYDEESPSLNLSKSTFFPFASSDGTSVDPTLASLAIGYNLSASRHTAKLLNGTGSDPVDTSTWYTREEYSVLHSPSISISPKLGYFSITPGISYSEAWLFRHHTRENIAVSYLRDSTGRIVDSTTTYTTGTTHGFDRLYSYGASLGIGTTLYGIANLNAFGIEAVRHTVIPNLSFSYHPDLSGQNYRTYVDPVTRQTVAYNIFDGEPNGGLVGLGRSEAVSISLGNNFDAKVERAVTKDSTAVDHVKLFNLNAGTSYDFVSKQWSTLGLSASSAIGTLFSIGASAQYSFYPVDSIGRTMTAHTLMTLGDGLMRPLSASANLTGSLSSGHTTDGENYDSLRRLFNITTPEDERALLLGGFFPGAFVSIPFRPTWNLTYGLSYTQSYAVTGIQRAFSATTSISLALTKNWSMSTSAAYDLVSKKILVPELRVHRDLDCWEMDLSYRPPGSQISGFNFVIRIKAPQLQDIKLMRTENSYGEF